MSNLPSKWLWFFLVDHSDHVTCECAEYDTTDRDEAIRLYEDEYGDHGMDAVERELTFLEYAGLLLCNRDSTEHDRAVYDAMTYLFFRVDPRQGENADA